MLPWNKLQSLSGKEFKILSPATPQKVRFGLSFLPGINVYNSKNVITENKTDLVNTFFNHESLVHFLFEQMDGEFDIYQSSENDRRKITPNLVFKTEVWAQFTEKWTVNLNYFRGKFINNAEMLAISPVNIGSFNQEIISITSEIKASGFGAGTNYHFTVKYFLFPYIGLDLGLQQLKRFSFQAGILHREFDLESNEQVINQLVSTIKAGIKRELDNRLSVRMEIAYPIPLSNTYPINPNTLSIYAALGFQLF